MKSIILLIPIALFANSIQAQLVIQSGATVFIDAGAKVVAQGDVTANTNILGTGTLTMKGSALQTLNMNGFTVPNLEIDNSTNVTLGTGSAVIGNNLLFTSGKLRTGSQDLIVNASATITGHNATRFVWTDGAGQLKKVLSANVTNMILPVGENNNYRPAYLTTVGSSFSSANVGVRMVGGPSPNMPPMIANYINGYWPVTRTGISGGTVTLSGQYNDPSDIIGVESNLSGYYLNNGDWTSVGETNNNATNLVSAPIPNAGGELFGMNKFIATGARAFLEGAYNTANGLMSDALRSGTNLIPLTDPYRAAPYSGAFTHVNNPNAESALGTVFTNQASADNDIVDWVFLELRNTNASPGNTVLQTRSALIQRDGDIVDIDGVSPVTFNNMVAGNYALSVRHRNHLGLSIEPVASPRTLGEAKSTAFTTRLINFTTATSGQLFGTSANYTTKSHPTLTNVNVLWGGNANFNPNVKYTGLANDKDYILVTTLANNPSTVLSNVYSAADINLNRVVRYNGLANDKDFLYLTVLQSTTVAQRLQSLPN